MYGHAFNRFIRLSAPLFNDVVVVGCIMCLSTVFLFGLRDFEVPETTMPPICKVNPDLSILPYPVIGWCGEIKRVLVSSDGHCFNFCSWALTSQSLPPSRGMHAYKGIV